MNIEIITAPIIGGLIGLITNSLAIKMLFRPYRAVKIGGIRLPFTPGLIPKEKTRVAHAIAQVISNYILDDDTILTALASEKIKSAYEQKYDEKFMEWKSTELTCQELLKKYDFEDSVNRAEADLRKSISIYLADQCQKDDFARKIIDYAFDDLKDNMNSFVYKIGRTALHAAKETMIERLEKLIAEHGQDLIAEYIDSVYEDWMKKPVCEIAEMFENKFPDFKETIWIKYTELIKNKFRLFISELNIQEIVENKVNDYDLEELEEMIMEISRKELNALVWLGGLLGIIMGFVNLLF